MPLNFNGTAISDVYFNGTKLDKINLNGVEVYSAVSVNVGGMSVYGNAVYETTTAGVRFDTDGKHYRAEGSNGNSYVASTHWLTGALASEYQLRFTLTAGTGGLIGATAGVWTTVTADIRIERTATTSDGQNISQYLVECRKVGTTTVLSSGTYLVSAEGNA